MNRYSVLSWNILKLVTLINRGRKLPEDAFISWNVVSDGNVETFEKRGEILRGETALNGY